MSLGTGEHTGGLASVAEIARLISTVDDYDTLLNQVNRAIIQLSVWNRSSILAVDFEANVTRLINVAGMYEGQKNPTYPVESWAAEFSPCAWVARSGDTLVIPDAQKQDEYPSYRVQAVAQDFHTLALVPIGTVDDEGRALVLSLKCRSIIALGNDEMDWIRAIGNLTALAVNKLRQLRAEARSNRELSRIVGTSSDLIRAALSSNELAEVVRQCDRVLSRPWLIVDFLTRMVYCSSHAPGDVAADDWAGLAQYGLKRHALEATYNAASHPDWRLEDDPVTLDLLPQNQAMAWHLEPLKVDNEIIGALLIQPDGKPLDILNFVSARAVQFSIAVQLQRSYIRLRSVAHSRSDILYRAFNDAFTRKEELISHARHAGLDLMSPQVMLLIRGEAEAMPENETLLMHSLQRTVDNVLGEAQIIRYGDDIVMLLGPEAGKKLTEPPVRDRLRREINWSYSDTAAISNCGLCNGLSELSRGFAEADKTLRLARSLKLTGWVTRDRLGSALVLLSLADNKIVDVFLDTELKNILVYDRDNNTDFFSTLRSFVEHEGRFQSSAEQLNLHSTTLRYRLSRIKDLFEIDATDPAKRFELNLAMKLMDLRELA